MQTWSEEPESRVPAEGIHHYQYVWLTGYAAGFPLFTPNTELPAERESATNRLLHEETHYDHHRIDNFFRRLDTLKHEPKHKPFGRFVLHLTRTLPDLTQPLTPNDLFDAGWHREDTSTEHTLGPYWKARKSCARRSIYRDCFDCSRRCSKQHIRSSVFP